MSELFMLDTNVASVIVKAGAAKTISPDFDAYFERQCLSVISEAELRFGVARKKEATRLAGAVNAFLGHIDILPWTSSVAVAYADMRSALEKKGIGIGSLDLLIAAHAAAVGAVLVTNDRALRQVSAFVRVESWPIC